MVSRDQSYPFSRELTAKQLKHTTVCQSRLRLLPNRHNESVRRFGNHALFPTLRNHLYSYKHNDTEK